MNGWYDDFDSLYELYDNDEPTLKIGNFVYNIQQYGDDTNPRKIHVTEVNLSNVPMNESYHNEKFVTRILDFENSFELINNFRFPNGKTIAQMMCDANNWDYSILPVYPNWLSPLGEL